MGSASKSVVAAEPLSEVLRENTTVAKHQNPKMTRWKRIRQAILNAAEFLTAQTRQISPPINWREIVRLRRSHRIVNWMPPGGKVYH